MKRLLAEMTSPEVALINKDLAVAMVPIGANEQHGPHLPVGTDTYILNAVLDEFLHILPEDFPLVVAPYIPIGKSNEHMPFAGTISFSYQTLMGVIRDICKSLERQGFKKIALFNSHGGNTDVLTSLCRDLRDELNVKVFVIDWWFTNFWADILAELQESPRDGVFHACELETSIMMYIKPGLVYRDKMAPGFPPEQLRQNKYVTIFGPVTMGWLTPDISPTGVIGDPTKATAEKGKRFIEYAAMKLVEIVEEIAAL